MERLQKIIANAGVASRRKAEKLIIDGKVTVNGIKVVELGTKVDINKDDIRVNGEKIIIDDEKVVILFNKPKKVVTTMEDPQNRKKIIDFINYNKRVYPVGRLDYETEGLILLTNDGELANKLMHPRYEIDKTYEAIINGIPSNEELNILRNGIKLDEGLTSKSEIKILKKYNNYQSKILITIHEGKYRQIRRMFEYINYFVLDLKRIKYSFLTLTGVNVGEYRFLSREEINRLKKILG